METEPQAEQVLDALALEPGEAEAVLRMMMEQRVHEERRLFVVRGTPYSPTNFEVEFRVVFYPGQFEHFQSVMRRMRLSPW